MNDCEKTIYIMSKLQEYKSILEKKYGLNVAYIALYGSQNYDLDMYTDEYMSDIDAKAVVLPSLDDLVYNSKPISTKYTMDCGEVDCKDIRLFTEVVSKANPAYIETLFTKYYIIDNNYLDEMHQILSKKMELAECLKYQFVRAMYGMMCEKFVALEHPYPSQIDKIEKYGYAGKQASHMYRLFDMLERFINNGEGLNTLFTPSANRKLKIIDYKLNKPTLEEAREFCLKIKNDGKELIDSFSNSISENKIDYTAKYDFQNISKEILKKRIITEVLCSYETGT